MNKPVAPEVLKAFGFRVIKKASRRSYNKNFTHYNPELDIFYGPKIHTQKQFAQNYTSGVAHRLIENINSSAINLIPRV